MKNSSRPNRAKATETRDRAGFSRPFLLQPPPLKRGALQGRAPPVVEAPRHGGTERALRHRYARLYHAHDKPHRSPPLPLPRRCARPRSGARRAAVGNACLSRARADRRCDADGEKRYLCVGDDPLSARGRRFFGFAGARLGRPHRRSPTTLGHFGRGRGRSGAPTHRRRRGGRRPPKKRDGPRKNRPRGVRGSAPPSRASRAALSRRARSLPMPGISAVRHWRHAIRPRPAMPSSPKMCCPAPIRRSRAPTKRSSRR